MTRPITAKIFTQALRKNLVIVKQYAENAKVWAVVKANAYGHGLQNVLPGLEEADGFAVLDIAEASVLRDQHWQKPILVLAGCFSPEEVTSAQALKLTLVVHQEEQLRMLELHKQSLPLNVYLKMNSGMNRLGFSPDRCVLAWQRLRRLPFIADMTLMTQFAYAYGNKEAIQRPSQIFFKIAKQLQAPCSIANSAAILWHPKTRCGWLRSGIMLYGASPSGNQRDILEKKLWAAMKLETRIIAIQNLVAGDSVSYGHKFTANRPMKIAVVACGYADGYPCNTGRDGAPVVVEKKRTRTVGRVCMDMICVDITDIPDAKIGSEVELWGENLSVDEVAQTCGTEAYELLCAVAPRVKRTRCDNYTQSI